MKFLIFAVTSTAENHKFDGHSFAHVALSFRR